MNECLNSDTMTRHSSTKPVVTRKSQVGDTVRPSVTVRMNFSVLATTKTVTRVADVNGIEIRHFPCALHCYQIGRNVVEGRPA